MHQAIFNSAERLLLNIILERSRVKQLIGVIGCTFLALFTQISQQQLNAILPNFFSYTETDCGDTSNML